MNIQEIEELLQFLGEIHIVHARISDVVFSNGFETIGFPVHYGKVKWGLTAQASRERRFEINGLFVFPPKFYRLYKSFRLWMLLSNNSDWYASGQRVMRR